MGLRIDTELFGNIVDFDICMRELDIFLNEIEKLFIARTKTLRHETEY